jgi:hypothetical protein
MVEESSPYVFETFKISPKNPFNFRKLRGWPHPSPPHIRVVSKIFGLVPEIFDKTGKNESELSPPTVIQSKKICQDN